MEKKPVKLTVVLQEWEESERGWGCRPDGISLHISMEACKNYKKQYWASMPKETPDEYEREASNAWLIELDDPDLISELLENESIRLGAGNPTCNKLCKKLQAEDNWHGRWAFRGAV